MWDEIKKVVVVVILTFLIWSLAYMALEESITQSGTLDISPQTAPDLFVIFVNKSRPQRIKITLKGPKAKITDLQKKLESSDPKQREGLDFYFDALTEDKGRPGTYEIELLALLKKSPKIKELGV